MSRIQELESLYENMLEAIESKDFAAIMKGNQAFFSLVQELFASTAPEEEKKRAVEIFRKWFGFVLRKSREMGSQKLSPEEEANLRQELSRFLALQKNAPPPPVAKNEPKAAEKVIDFSSLLRV